MFPLLIHFLNWYRFKLIIIVTTDTYLSMVAQVSACLLVSFHRIVLLPDHIVGEHKHPTTTNKTNANWYFVKTTKFLYLIFFHCLKIWNFGEEQGFPLDVPNEEALTEKKRWKLFKSFLRGVEVGRLGGSMRTSWLHIKN